MTECFEIISKDIMARVGKLHTSNGIVETPTLMPVINPNMVLIPPEDMRKYGAEILITNAYIIYRNQELREAAAQGVHTLLGWDGPLMTDSGSYQLSVYGDVEISNQEILTFQQEIGSDIAVPLDIPTAPDTPLEQAQQELKETMCRLKEAREFIKEDDNMLLAGTIQGSTHLDLRMEAAEQASEIGFDIYPIGGMVSLLESYRYADIAEIIMRCKMSLPPEPVHLFGAGHPMLFALAAALGCDLFDSAAYVLYARDDRYLMPEGTYGLSDLRYFPCSCPICSSYTPEEVMESHDKVRLLAEHNLYVSFAEIRKVKQSIRENRLWELVERRCGAHPRLLDGLNRVLNYGEFMERFDPVNKSLFFYTGEISTRRPDVRRYGERLERLTLSGKVLVSTWKSTVRKLEGGFDIVFLMHPLFGPYPVELKETYPIGQAELPKDIEPAAREVALKHLIRLLELNPDVEFTVVYDERWRHPLMEKIKELAEGSDKITVLSVDEISTVFTDDG